MTEPGPIMTRRTGATATLVAHGTPGVVSATGGHLDVVTRPSEPGFNPLDLLFASLSACLVLSARMAAANLGVLDKVGDIRAEVTGTKAAEGPSRLERFHVIMSIGGTLDAAAKDAIVEGAEAICTVSNTLRGTVHFEIARA